MNPSEEGGLEEFDELVDLRPSASSSFSTRFFNSSTDVLN